MFFSILALGLLKILERVRQIAAVRVLIKEVYDGIVWMSESDEMPYEKFAETPKNFAIPALPTLHDDTSE